MKNPRSFGYHLMLDLYRCDPNKVGDLNSCYRYLDELPRRIGMDKQSPPFIFFTDAEKYPDKAGLSGWVPVVESGISIHTLSETNFISIDVYSCLEFDLEEVTRYTVDYFKPEKVEDQFVYRGKEYY